MKQNDAECRTSDTRQAQWKLSTPPTIRTVAVFFTLSCPKRSFEVSLGAFPLNRRPTQEEAGVTLEKPSPLSPGLLASCPKHGVLLPSPGALRQHSKQQSFSTATSSGAQASHPLSHRLIAAIGRMLRGSIRRPRRASSMQEQVALQPRNTHNHGNHTHVSLSRIAVEKLRRKCGRVLESRNGTHFWEPSVQTQHEGPKSGYQK